MQCVSAAALLSFGLVAVAEICISYLAFSATLFFYAVHIDERLKGFSVSEAWMRLVE